MSMALVMSEMPDIWRKVLAEHVPDGAQRCRECRDAAGGHATWPCQTYRVAQEAKWVAEGNLPGTGPHGPGPKAAPRLSPPDRSPSRHEHPADGWGGDHRPANPFSAPEPATGSTFLDGLAGRSTPSWSGPPSGPTPRPDLPTGTGAFRPLAGDPLGTPYPEPMGTSSSHSGERPYGSTFDAPYGASFGVDDRPRSRH